MAASAGALEMTCRGQAELERTARSHPAVTNEVRQAKAKLWATNGGSKAAIACRCEAAPKSVRRGRGSFAAEGALAVGRIRAGRPVVFEKHVVEKIVHETMRTVPEDGSARLSTRSMAAR